MTIPDDLLDDLVDAMERAYGKRPSRGEARDAGMRLLALMELLSTPPESNCPQDEQQTT